MNWRKDKPGPICPVCGKQCAVFMIGTHYATTKTCSSECLSAHRKKQGKNQSKENRKATSASLKIYLDANPEEKRRRVAHLSRVRFSWDGKTQPLHVRAARKAAAKLFYNGNLQSNKNQAKAYRARVNWYLRMGTCLDRSNIPEPLIKAKWEHLQLKRALKNAQDTPSRTNACEAGG